jgi:hypothetical protein
LLTEHFSETVGHGVRKVGGALARHFLRQAGDPGELSYQIARD